MNDEYEVDLMDYLRVMWNWKWVIIGCLIVAVGVAAAVSYTQPNRYTGTVTYQLDGLGSTLGVTGINVDTLNAAAAGIGVTSIGPGIALNSHKTGNQVTIALTGAISPSALRTALARLTPLLTAGVTTTVRAEMNRALTLAHRRQTQLTAESNLLRQQMENSSSPDLSTAIAERIADIALQLAQVKVQIESLTAAQPTDLFILRAVTTPTITRVGPHRNLNIAVAAVLGLFVGILIAFFINYIVSYHRHAA